MPVYGVNTKEGTSHLQPSLLTQEDNNIFGKNQGQNFKGQLTDWRVLDNSVAPQLLNQGDDLIKQNHHRSYPNEEKQIIVPEDESYFIYNDRIDLWK
ncbi:hypothetical protein R6Q57_027241 [Mikania cordata]